MYLQNVFSASHPSSRVCRLSWRLPSACWKKRGGAYRVHGGGFAGTVQTFVPVDYLPEFVKAMEAVTGEGLHNLRIRPVGGTRIL